MKQINDFLGSNCFKTATKHGTTINRDIFSFHSINYTFNVNFWNMDEISIINKDNTYRHIFCHLLKMWIKKNQTKKSF